MLVGIREFACIFVVSGVTVAVGKRQNHRYWLPGIGRINNVHIQGVAFGISVRVIVDRGVVLEISHVAGYAIALEQNIASVVRTVVEPAKRARFQCVINSNNISVYIERNSHTTVIGVIQLNDAVTLRQQPGNIIGIAVLTYLAKSEIFEIYHSHRLTFIIFLGRLRFCNNIGNRFSGKGAVPLAGSSVQR